MCKAHLELGRKITFFISHRKDFTVHFLFETQKMYMQSVLFE